MRYLTLPEIMEIHKRLLQQSGGETGIRDVGMLESAAAQPRMTFEGEELYPSVVQQAAALAFSLIMNYPFIDGNKRAGHACMEMFLLLNGYELLAPVDEQERIILQVASGNMQRDTFALWLSQHTVER